MNFVPEWAPNVHPMVIHFPLALLWSAVLVDFLALVGRRLTWLRRSAVLLYVLGAMAAVVAYFTGSSAAESIAVPEAAESVLTAHENLALWTTVFFVIYGGARLAVEITVGTTRWSLHLLAGLPALVGLYLLWETGGMGSEMVFRHGVGVAAASAPAVPEVEVPPMAGESGLALLENGWMWAPGAGAAGVLDDTLANWPLGREAVHVEATSEDAVRMVVERPVMMTASTILRRTRVAVEAALSDSTPPLELVHHAVDALNYDYLRIEDGRASLGRVRAGERQDMDTGTYAASGWARLRVVGDGTHFRGYVNDDMVVHGHTSEADPGMAGVLLQGPGELVFRNLRAEEIN